MPPRATEPKLTDAGATEIVAAPGVLCWFDAALDTPVSPMQPELDRMAKSRRTRAATGIALLHAELACVARLPAQPNHSFIFKCFIEAIVVRGKREDYCPNGHLKDRGENLHLAHTRGGKRRTAQISLRTARRIRFTQIPPESTGRLL